MPSSFYSRLCIRLSLVLSAIVLLSNFGIAQETRPVHVEEWEYYRQHPEQIGKQAIPFKSGKRPLDAPVALSKVVYGFHPYWISAATASNYYFSLLTHMAYFSADVDTAVSTTGNFMTTNSWNTAQSVTYAQNAGVKVHLTVVMFANHSRVLNTAAYRTNLVNNIITLLNNRNAAGVVIDFESMSSSVSTNFKLFIKELGDALAANGKELAICLPAVDWSSIFTSTFFSYNNSVVTYYFLMAYDYYYRGSANAGPCAPLTTGTSSYHVSRSINTYITAGATAAKIIAGFPYYGYDWPVVSNARMAATTGSAASITYANAKTAVAAIISSDKFVDATYNTPWYRYQSGSQWHQVWYEDSLSLAKKYDTVLAKGLAGTGMWALSYDGSNTELWGAIKDAFGSSQPAQYTVLDNFESGVGRFDQPPSFSGSTRGIASTSTSARTVAIAKNGAGALKVTLQDSAAISIAWTVRLLSGGGAAVKNSAVNPDGYFGFWLKTSTAATGAQVAVTVDDIADGTELSPKQTIINDDAWHYYEFNMKGSGWTNFAAGNGSVTGTTATLDAIMLYSPNTSTDWVVYIDDVYYITTTALPVELTSFSYSVKNGVVEFNWVTQTEVNTSHFILERKTDAGLWQLVGRVAATGNSNSEKKYRLTENTNHPQAVLYRLKAVDNDGSESVCRILEVHPEQVTTFIVGQNFPNPFNPSTKIGYRLPEAALVQLQVFSITGELVYQWLEPEMAAGYHEIVFDGANLAGGVYLYRINAAGKQANTRYSAGGKMILLK